MILPPLSDKGDGCVASSVTWQSNKSINIKSDKTVGNNVLHSLAVAYEGGLFSFGEIVSNVFHLSFLAGHLLTCVAGERCCTGKASKWSNFDSLQGAKPIKKQTCLKDVFGRCCRHGKGFNPLCAACGAMFFLQPYYYYIGVDISATVWDWYGHIHTQFYAYGYESRMYSEL